MLIDIVAVIVGFIILVWGAERFITGASAIAGNLGVSPMLIGLTIVGFGTSAPEIIVSSMAALQGNTGMAIGNAIGSNIANIALILGTTALISPLNVHSGTLRREYPILLAICLVAVLLMYDLELSRVDGIIFITILIAVLYSMVRLGMRQNHSDPLGQEFEAEIPSDISNTKAVVLFLLGLAALIISSRILVWGAVNIASAFGVSDLIIGLTIIALGTSLPELAASIMSAIKKEHDLAIGNIIGSNMFNILAVMAMPALIAPGPFEPLVFSRDMLVMISLTLALFVMGYGFGGPGRINRFEGLLLLLAFITYQGMLFNQAANATAHKTSGHTETTHTYSSAS